MPTKKLQIIDKLVNVDDTLTQSGVPADAAAVGAAIENLDNVCWDNISGKPFTTTNGSDTLSWDGNIEGLVHCNSLYKVSNAVPTRDDLVNGFATAIMMSGAIAQEMSVDGTTAQSLFNEDGYLTYYDGALAIVPHDNYNDGNGLIFPEAGTYLFMMAEGMYVPYITINGYTGFNKIDILGIKNGGTGATTAEEALLNLGGFPNCKPVRTPDTDLDDYKTEGWYFFTTTYTPINIPGGGNGWLCVLSNNNQVFVKQIFYRAGTPNSNDYMAWTRTYTSAAGWSAWAEIYTSKHSAFKGADSTAQASLQSAPAASSGAGLWVYGLDHANSGQFRLQTYNADNSTYYQLRGNPNGVMSWNGTLYVNNTTDASSTSDNNAGLIVGDRSGEHIAIDGNEIIPKSGAKAGGTLYLGDSEDTVISISGLFRVNSYSYGDSLPSAGIAGRVFFKKVT